MQATISVLALVGQSALCTVSAEGQPYIQYRGGSPGFLKVVDGRTLGFADFRGNRQYITLGNLSENPQAFIFLIDYAHSRRIKLWGSARVVEDDPALLNRLRDPSYPGKVERAILFEVEAWDVNCPQHIHKRFSQQHVAPVIEQLQAKIGELEAKLKALESKGQNSWKQFDQVQVCYMRRCIEPARGLEVTARGAVDNLVGFAPRRKPPSENPRSAPGMQLGDFV